MNLLKIIFSILILSSCGIDQNTFDKTTQVYSPYEYPFFPYQWHLVNTGQFSGTPGEDLNIESVWNSGNKGADINVVIIDDGLEIAHPDLFSNIDPVVSGKNYTTGTTDPTPSNNSPHGTCVAGIIAARDSNGIGLSGAAPRANLIGYNVLQNYTVANIENAMTENYANIDISNNSWGNYDLGHFYTQDIVWYDAIWDSLTTGRGGLGTIFVWAAGNGGQYSELSIYDPYPSHPGVIAVAAIDNNGRHHSYSEQGANLWISAPSGGPDRPDISTTDLAGPLLGYNTNQSTGDYNDYDYTNSFAGTSAAAPMVSGVTALLLKEHPLLGWRDVKLVLAQSARKNDPTNSLWSTNDAGLEVNYKYGFGAVDAQSAIDLASGWTNVTAQTPELHPSGDVQNIDTAIDDIGTPVQSQINISSSNISNISFIEVTINISYLDWGKLEIVLQKNGSSFSSILATPHSCYDIYYQQANCYVTDDSFVFGVARHLNEDPQGDWNISVKSVDASSGETGTFDSWRLKIYGY